MMEEPIHILLQAVWLFAAGLYPLGFLFGACSACCEDSCQWLINLDGCLKVTVVGSSPETGTTCSVRSVSGMGAGNAPLSGGTGLEYAFNVVRVPQEVEVSVRVSVSASSLTETSRTIVYRIPQSHCVAGCVNNSLAVAYDDSSPGWHLEVELTVNRVTNLLLAGIVSQSVGLDSAGQPKMILEVNCFQSSNLLVVSGPMAIRPSGIQRAYGISNNAAGVVFAGSGTGVSVFVQATSVTKQASAIYFAGEVCGVFPGINKSLRSKYKFDRVTEFLAGETFRVDSVNDTQKFDITFMPTTVLCDMPTNFLGAGLILEAYPETIFIDTGLSDPCFGDISVQAGPDAAKVETFITGGRVDFLNANPQISPSAPCIHSWFKTYRTPTKSVSGFDRLDQANTYDAARAYPSDFYAGKSLLWNIGRQPYRRSFSGLSINGRNVTFRLDGSASQTSGYYQSENVSPACREGLSLIGEKCVPPSITVSFGDISFSGTWRRWLGDRREYGESEPLSGTIHGGTLTLTPGDPGPFPDFDVFRPTNTAVRNIFNDFFQDTPLLQYGVARIVNATMDNGLLLGVFQVVKVHIYHNPCDPVQTVTPVGLVVASHADIGFLYLSDPAAIIEGRFQWDSPTSAYGNFGTVEISAEAIEIRSRMRKVCNAWGPATLPASGGTLTRQCNLQDAPGETYQTISESIVFPASGNLTSRVIGGGVVQEGVCRLVSLKSQPSTFAGSLFNDPSVHSFVPRPGEPCMYLRPIFKTDSQGVNCEQGIAGFGSFGSNNVPHPARASQGDDSPCLSDCTITAEVTQNHEQLAAEYITAGDKAGLVQLVAKEGWSESSTATLVVSCGDDSIQVTIRGFF